MNSIKKARHAVKKRAIEVEEGKCEVYTLGTIENVIKKIATSFPAHWNHERKQPIFLYELQPYVSFSIQTRVRSVKNCRHATFAPIISVRFRTTIFVEIRYPLSFVWVIQKGTDKNAKISISKGTSLIDHMTFTIK